MQCREVSDAAASVWAKSVRGIDPAGDGTAALTGWLSLKQHLDDTGSIAGKLWDEDFWAPSTKQRLIDRFGGDEAAARALMILLAACHDIGKASPAFVVQCKDLLDPMRDHGLRVNMNIAQTDERREARHELVSHIAFMTWAMDRGAGRKVAQQLASVLGTHHGRPLSSSILSSVGARYILIGEGLWESVRTEFLERAASHPEVAPHLETIFNTELRQTDVVLLNGMLIVADWLASNTDFFPIFDIGAAPKLDQAERLAKAWAVFNPPASWQPNPPTDANKLMHARFDLPPGASPHPTQREFIELAARAERPRLMILEAAMGSGKTEAALAAAEVLAQKFGCNGLYVAMPTQATSDGMFARVRAWAAKAHIDSSIFLAHGNSELNDEFDTLTREAWYRSVAPDQWAATHGSERRPAAHRWFSGNKKGPLANLVVGTIDQLLYMALQTHQVALRHLAFAGKVVVIDEAHSFDVYMGEFFERAVEWLGAYGVPTIILSATLPAERRRALVEAYELGRATEESFGLRSVPSQPQLFELEGDIGYPVMIGSGDTAEVVLPGWNGTSRRIALERSGDDPLQIAALLRARLRDGGCVAVIRNTVRRAQELASVLRAEFPDIPVTLAHSRFMAGHRAEKDRTLLDQFGSPSRARERPAAAIVVATQVIEQSLDLDFDLMITDIAPIDLLLQRAGRLHRHDRPKNSRPERVRDPRLVVTVESWGEVLPKPDSGSAYVYGKHLLLRTLAELREREELVLPDDIAPLVQRVYSDESYVGAEWQQALGDARAVFKLKNDQNRDVAGPFLIDETTHRVGSLVGWANNSVSDPESNTEQGRQGRAAVRRTGETLEVFGLFTEDGMTLRTAPGGRGVALPLNEAPDRALARTILRGAMKISEVDCRRYGADSVTRRGGGIDLLIAHLENREVNQARQVQQARELEGELMVVFDRDGVCALPYARLFYSEEEGLRIEHS